MLENSGKLKRRDILYKEKRKIMRKKGI